MAKKKQTQKTIQPRDLLRASWQAGQAFTDLKCPWRRAYAFWTTWQQQGIADHDRDILLDLYDAARFVYFTDYSARPFDLNFLKAINARLTRSASIWPGRLRTKASVVIPLADGLGNYVPEPPREDDLARTLASYGAASPTMGMSDAVNLFVTLCSLQPFDDGNKRTAFFAANALAIKNRWQHPFAVPYVAKDLKQFNLLLSKFYESEDEDSDEIAGWLTCWNEEHEADLKKEKKRAKENEREEEQDLKDYFKQEYTHELNHERETIVDERRDGEKNTVNLTDSEVENLLELLEDDTSDRDAPGEPASAALREDIEKQLGTAWGC